MKDIDEDGYVVRPNKTLIKQEIAEYRTLTEQLIELPSSKLDRISLRDELLAAVLAGRKMKKSALQRQLRYITGILKGYDDEEIAKIQKQYEVLMLPQQQANASLHQLESWRDRLIIGDEELLNDLVKQYGADRQHMRQLLRNIQKEQKQQLVKEGEPEKGEALRSPKTARVLFKYLQELLINYDGQ